MFFYFLFVVAVLSCSSPDGAYNLTEFANEFAATFPGEDGTTDYVGNSRWYVSPCGVTTETDCAEGAQNATAVCQLIVSGGLHYKTAGLSTTAVWSNASAQYPLAERAFSVRFEGGNACGGTNASATVFYVCNRTEFFDGYFYGESVGITVKSWDGCNVEIEWQSAYLCPPLPPSASTTTQTGDGSASSSGGDGDDTGVIAGMSAGIGGVLLLCCVATLGVCAVCFVIVVFLICCAVVVFLCISAAVSAVSAISAYLVRRMRKRLLKSGDFKMKDLPPLCALGYRPIPMEDIQFGDCIGSGAFGEVFRGKWRRSPVALKVVRVRSKEAMQDFHKEAALMTRLGNHVNIVQFLGVAERERDGGIELVLVSRLYELGSLHSQFVRDQKEMTMGDFYDIVWDMATGLDYMHNNGVIHRDIALRNCLQGADGRVVLSDFGTSRILGDGEASATTKSDIGPVRWMAPESLRDQEYSAKSDMWMFGVAVWELWTREVPYKNMGVLEVATGVKEHKLLLDIPEGAPEPVKDIIRGCTFFDPESRISLNEVFDILRDLSSRAGEEVHVEEEEAPNAIGEYQELHEPPAYARKALKSSEYVAANDVPEEK